jgi:hypothetical protein
MTEHLERLIQATEGQPPSGDFVARLRAQIVAETEGTGAGAGQAGARTEDAAPDSVIEGVPDHDDDIAVVLDIEPSPNDENRLATRRALVQRRTQRLAAAAAVAAAFIGIWALISTFEDDQVLLDTDTATSEPSQPDNDDEGRQLLTAGNTFFDAGTYRIDTLGTAFTFSVDETTGLFLNDNGVVSITDLTSVGADDRTITLRRTTLLPDPSDPTAKIDPTGGWPVTDLRGWVGAVSDNVTASEPIDATLGGLDATYVALEVGELNCNTADCASEDPEERPDRPIFSLGSAYQLWVVDQGEEDPVVVTVAVDDPDETAWFDDAAAILATLEFDSVQPSPVRQAAAGPAELDVFGGITLLAPEEIVIVEPFDRFARIFPADIGGDVEFLTSPLDTDGVELTTTDRLLRLLTDEAIEFTEFDSADIGGLEARTFEVLSGPFPNVVLKARTADLVRPEFGWEPPQSGHLWVIEHPDRGLLLVSTEALAGPEAIEPLRSWTADMLQSLEFREQ